MSPDPGSFRDPAGRVYIRDDRVLRAVYEMGRENFEAADKAGVLDALIAKDLLIGATKTRSKLVKELDPEPCHVLSHPLIPFISYPYEWTFSQLKAAALLHLELHLEALKLDFTLCDATAYNVQFQGTTPIFIDHLSIVPYEEGEIWAGHRQFCMQFLNPLILWAKRGVVPNSWYRGSVEGIPPEDLAAVLKWRDKLSFTVLAHVVTQAKVHSHALKTETKERVVSARKLPKRSLVAMLEGLKDYIKGLELPGGRSVWSEYADDNSYNADKRAEKHEFVAAMASKVKPKMMFDIGCNSGDFTATALDAGAKSVVAFDFDYGALEQAYSRFSQSKQPVMPLWLDAANPSPAQGWANAERASLNDRGNVDAMVALAVIHHIAIGRNVPLDMAVDWLIGLAPQGVIEFPNKDDVMVRKLLANRKDIFPDYTEEAFLHHVGERAKIVKQKKLGEDGRLIVRYRRN
ncbi:class I SAM-dependent methyltransferase [Parasphingopyxis sp. GrpM-11]|uniref:Class I SAM-dependent methyltransferase n=1 Tax=Parasphingopyxis marina TaxID=2761622 RepID=A0A842HTC3_9SPHN|nr:class I SAM-dependent methyltransferase [Parasphingopyxis marina]